MSTVPRASQARPSATEPTEARHGGTAVRALGPVGRATRAVAALLAGAGRRLWDGGGTNLAAALAYYAMLSLFPLMIAVVAIAGLVADYPRSVDDFLRVLGEFAPQDVVDTIRGPLDSIVRSKGGSSAMVSVGLVLTLWWSSGYAGTFAWCSSRIYDPGQGRRYSRALLLRFLTALLTVAVMATAISTVLLTRSAATWIGEELGVLDTMLRTWAALRWPVFFGVAFVLVGGLMATGPSPRRRLREVAPGALLGIGLWALASYGFSLYLQVFDYYDLNYGTLGAIVVFLLWLWLFNLALLFGAAVNAELPEWRAGRLTPEQRAD